MAKSLVLLSRGEAFRSLRYYDQTNLYYIREAGVADVRAELMAQPDWVTGFSDKTLSDVPGSYSVVFNTTGTNFQPDESVNNLSGSGSVPGPRGNVPAGCVDLALVARSRGLESRVYVLLRRGADVARTDSLYASGRIRMLGQVSVDGIKSFEDPQPVAAGIHSNLAADASGLITWTGAAGESAAISGKVTSVSSNAGAIDFSGTYTSAGLEVGVGAATPPRPDLAGIVAGQTALPPPSWNPTGTTTIGADSYQSGSVTLNGDLVLNGGKLYVDGDLEVNGSISGVGSVYVTGKTSFKGDSQVLTNRAQGVALFSKGSVKLEGFDGMEYLQALAATDPALATDLANVQALLTEYQSTIQSGSIDSLMGEGSHLDVVRRSLAGYNGIPLPGYPLNTLGRLKTRLEAAPPSQARDFLIERVGALRGELANATEVGSDNPAAMDAWTNGQPDPFGVWNAAIDTFSQPILEQLVAQADRFTFDRLGNSSFSGLIYTNGAFYAGHQVDVMGAVIVEGDPTQADLVVGADTLRPGDIVLQRGVNLTYNEEFVSTGLSVLTSSGLTSLELWLEP